MMSSDFANETFNPHRKDFCCNHKNVPQNIGVFICFPAVWVKELVLSPHLINAAVIFFDLDLDLDLDFEFNSNLRLRL